MTINMNSLWDFTPAVKFRHISTSFSGYIQHSILAGPTQKLNNVKAPLGLLLGSRQFRKNSRQGRIPFATESNKAVVADSTTTDSRNVETAVTNDQLSSTDSQTNVNGSEKTSPEMQKPMSKRSPLTAREKLRAARVLSRFTDSKPSKPALGSNVLDALRESDRGKKRSGLPEAPTNLFDDSKRGMPKQGLTFDLPGGNELFLIIFSAVFIGTVMFATAFIVWKAGAIHFNE